VERKCRARGGKEKVREEVGDGGGVKEERKMSMMESFRGCGERREKAGRSSPDRAWALTRQGSHS